MLDWDDQVSRLHARFERVGDAWVLVDDGLSSNGTFVNGERVSGRRRLNDGDTLRFGTTTITFRAPARKQSGSANVGGTASRGGTVDHPAPRPGGTVPSVQRSQRFASPATDEEIAEELFLSVGEVRAHLRVLYAKLGVAKLPQAEMRVRLVERAFSDGLISERDL